MSENNEFPTVEIPSYEYEELLAAREVCYRLTVDVNTGSAYSYWQYLHDKGCDIRNGSHDPLAAAQGLCNLAAMEVDTGD